MLAVGLESDCWEALRVLASSLLDARPADMMRIAIDNATNTEQKGYIKMKEEGEVEMQKKYFTIALLEDVPLLPCE